MFTKWPVFKNLKDVPRLYKQGRVDVGGYRINWNDEIDLEGNELRETEKMFKNGKD